MTLTRLHVSFLVWCSNFDFGPPTSRGLVWLINGCRARKLPVAPPKLIRRDLAQSRSLKELRLSRIERSNQSNIARARKR